MSGSTSFPIDVMLVLLVIFMVTAPILTQGVVVDLPKAPSEPIAENQEDPLVVTMREDGALFINLGIRKAGKGTRVTIFSLSEQAAKIIGARPDVPVYVRADHRLDYGEVVKVMTRCRPPARQRRFITDPPDLSDTDARDTSSARMRSVRAGPPGARSGRRGAVGELDTRDRYVARDQAQHRAGAASGDAAKAEAGAEAGGSPARTEAGCAAGAETDAADAETRACDTETDTQAGADAQGRSGGGAARSGATCRRAEPIE
jgi:biopolymer transport protein TolR